MLFAVYSYARKVIKNRANANEIEDVEEGVNNHAIPISMAESELQILTINAINCLIKQNDAIESRFLGIAGKLDTLPRLDIQIKNIVHKIDTMEHTNQVYGNS